MTEQLKRAIDKASKTKMTVRYLGARQYLVVTPQNHKYTVRFAECDGQRFGRCTCAAGSARRPCYHLPKAGLVDTAIQHMLAQ